MIFGRADDMLNIGGLKVAPQSIEEYVKSIDGVTDAALVARDAADSGATLHLFIECRERACFAPVGRCVNDGLRHESPIIPLYGTDPPRTATGTVRCEMLRAYLERNSGMTGHAPDTPGAVIDRGSTMRSKSASVT
jgi:acyl-coenzyme A synthetase/AMP-(fatty) acid ligase